VFLVISGSIDNWSLEATQNKHIGTKTTWPQTS